jgi:hypothetical protein
MKSTAIAKALVVVGILGSMCRGPCRSLVAQAPTPGVAGDVMVSMQQQIVAKEREGLDALKTGDLDLFGKLTADEAVMVDAQGPATKAQVLQNVGEFKLTDYSMEDLKFVPVSATTGLISYKITEKGVSHGHEFVAKAYVSSLWTKRDAGWVCLFSQETGTK